MLAASPRFKDMFDAMLLACNKVSGMTLNLGFAASMLVKYVFGVVLLLRLESIAPPDNGITEAKHEHRDPRTNSTTRRCSDA
jgi:hypothetical protein